MKFVNLFLIIIFASSSQAFAKTKFVAPIGPIDSSYYLEIITNQNDCQKATGKSCFFRDHAIDEKPYFHKTKIIIFQSKIIAIQESNHKDKFIKIKDLQHNFTTTSGNLISFDAKNGEIFNLNLLKGNLKKEKIEESNCVKTKIFYDFYKTYNRENEVISTLGSFEDEYNFSSMSQYFIFAAKNDPANVMALQSDADEDFAPIDNLKLCKFPDTMKANVKHISLKDCADQMGGECFKYRQCEDYVEVKDCRVVVFGGF